MCIQDIVLPHLSLMSRLNSFFSLALFFLWIHNGRGKKLTTNYMEIRRFFKDVIYLFCFQKHLKQFLENYRLYRKSGDDVYSRGYGGSCYLRHFFRLHTKIDMYLTPYLTVSLMKNLRNSYLVKFLADDL